MVLFKKNQGIKWKRAFVWLLCVKILCGLWCVERWIVESVGKPHGQVSFCKKNFFSPLLKKYRKASFRGKTNDSLHRLWKPHFFCFARSWRQRPLCLLAKWFPSSWAPGRWRWPRARRKGWSQMTLFSLLLPRLNRKCWCQSIVLRHIMSCGILIQLKSIPSPSF